MPSSDPRLKTRARRSVLLALRRAVAEQGRGCEYTPCLMPGVPIDLNNPRSPAYLEGDEILARIDGGSPEDPFNVRPAHARCNRAGGAAITNGRRPDPLIPLDHDEW